MYLVTNLCVLKNVEEETSDKNITEGKIYEDTAPDLPKINNMYLKYLMHG